MRAGGGISSKEIEDEFRAVSSLCMSTAFMLKVHDNLVEVLQNGKLPGSPYYFLEEGSVSKGLPQSDGKAGAADLIAAVTEASQVCEDMWFRDTIKFLSERAVAR